MGKRKKISYEIYLREYSISPKMQFEALKKKKKRQKCAKLKENPEMCKIGNFRFHPRFVPRFGERKINRIENGYSISTVYSLQTTD